MISNSKTGIGFLETDLDSEMKLKSQNKIGADRNFFCPILSAQAQKFRIFMKKGFIGRLYCVEVSIKIQTC